MAFSFSQIIDNLCAELIKTNASFYIAQRSAFIDLWKDQLERIMLNENYFLGIEEISFQLYLKPKKIPWFRRIFKWFKTDESITYELVNSSHPGSILCEIKIQRNGKTYKASMFINQTETKTPIYVD